MYYICKVRLKLCALNFVWLYRFGRFNQQNEAINTGVGITIFKTQPFSILLFCVIRLSFKNHIYIFSCI